MHRSFQEKVVFLGNHWAPMMTQKLTTTTK